MSNLIQRLQYMADDTMGMEPEDRRAILEAITELGKLNSAVADKDEALARMIATERRLDEALKKLYELENIEKAHHEAIDETDFFADKLKETEAERKAVIKASPVAGEYDETVDRESAHEILQKRTAKHAEAQAAEAEEKAQSKKSGGGSRSDSFWTSLGKAIVKSAVPMATRVLEDSIKRGALGGIQRKR